MEEKRFLEKDEEFVCRNCGKKVEKLNYTSRDHCPYCLYSIHIDNNPGDRSCTCLGNLVPIGVEKAKKDKLKIIYKCDKCNIIKKNIEAIDDDRDTLIKISVIS